MILAKSNLCKKTFSKMMYIKYNIKVRIVKNIKESFNIIFTARAQIQRVILYLKTGFKHSF